MHPRFTLLGAVLGLALLATTPLRAAEMPSVDDLQAQMGVPAGSVTVYEPHLSVGDEHVAIDYVGYPAVDVMARLFGPDWQRRGRDHRVPRAGRLRLAPAGRTVP